MPDPTPGVGSEIRLTRLTWNAGTVAKSGIPDPREEMPRKVPHSASLTYPRGKDMHVALLVRLCRPHIPSLVTMATIKPGVIALFDVDGTLTPARKQADPEMLKFMQELRKVVTVGIVGGSDLSKISEQLGPNTLTDYDYVFSENGLVAHKQGQLIAEMSLKDFLGEEKLKKLINFILHYIADLDIPIKRGTFVEFRMGMLNVSPIGRNCSHAERDEFEKFDKVAGVRAKMVAALQEKFADWNLTFSIGGQISFDVFPKGWDKTYCLPFVEKDYSEIHFFGDKTYKVPAEGGGAMGGGGGEDMGQDMLPPVSREGL
eukprot:jgi/Mesvir1/15787/Mv03353-RA.1